MDGRLACHRDRLALLFAKPTTTTHRDRAAAAVKQCQYALDGANEIGMPSTLHSTLRSATADSSTSSTTGECRTHHDVGGGRNHETNIALVRGRVAGVDRAGSVGARMSRVSMVVSRAERPVSTEARGLGGDMEDESAAKAEILPSPANTVVGDTILQSGEQRIQIVCAAEAEMNWRVASHCVATEATMEDGAHPCHLAGCRINGNRAGTSTTAVKEGPGAGVEQPTKEGDTGDPAISRPLQRAPACPGQGGGISQGGLEVAPGQIAPCVASASPRAAAVPSGSRNGEPAPVSRHHAVLPVMEEDDPYGGDTSRDIRGNVVRGEGGEGGGDKEGYGTTATGGHPRGRAPNITGILSRHRPCDVPWGAAAPRVNSGGHGNGHRGGEGRGGDGMFTVVGENEDTVGGSRQRCGHEQHTKTCRRSHKDGPSTCAAELTSKMKLGRRWGNRAPQVTTTGGAGVVGARDPNALERETAGARFGRGQHCVRRVNSSDERMVTIVQEGSNVSGDGGDADGRGFDSLSADDERASGLAPPRPPPAVGDGHGSIEDVQVEGEDQQWKRRVVAERGNRAQFGNECVATCNIGDRCGGEEEASSWYSRPRVKRAKENVKPDGRPDKRASTQAKWRGLAKEGGRGSWTTAALWLAYMIMAYGAYGVGAEETCCAAGKYFYDGWSNSCKNCVSGKYSDYHCVNDGFFDDTKSCSYENEWCEVLIPKLDPLNITKIAGSTGSKWYQCSDSGLAAGTCGVCNQGKCIPVIPYKLFS